MQAHFCKNCSLIEQKIQNEFNKHQRMTIENLFLHKSLMSAKDEIIKSTLEVANLKDGLTSERQRSFNLFLQLQTAMSAVQPSVNVRVNYDNNENKTDDRYKRVTINSVSATKAINNEMNSGFKYKEYLVDLEADLELYQITNEICMDKLKNEIESAKSHSSFILEMYKRTHADLINERMENIKLRKSLRATIDNITQENTKQIEIAKKQIAAEAYRNAHVYARENLNMLQQQLAERDKLVSQLRQQLFMLEDIVKKQQSGLKAELDRYKNANEDLKRRIVVAQEKYTNLEHRRQLEHEGFFSDLSNIRKELNRIKNNINKADRNNIQDNLTVIGRQVNDVHLALSANYYVRK